MDFYSTKLSMLTATLGTIFTWLFGIWDQTLIALLVFMAVDYLTGVARGFVNKELSSNTGFIGLARKGVILLVLIIAVTLDRLLGSGWTVRTAICYFYLANEGLSILENLASMGVPFPEKLRDVLLQLKQGQKKETIGSEKNENTKRYN